jgi:hypothetical protein
MAADSALCFLVAGPLKDLKVGGGIVGYSAAYFDGKNKVCLNNSQGHRIYPRRQESAGDCFMSLDPPLNCARKFCLPVMACRYGV